MSTCRRVMPLLDAFGDGELSPEQVLQVEQHLVDCSHCTVRVQLDEAVRVSMQRAARSVAPSTDFRDRLMGALAAERQREQEAAEQPSYVASLSWRTIAPIAVAASLAIVFAAARSQPEQMGVTSQAVQAQVRGDSSTTLSSSTATVTSAVEQLIDELVTHHQAAPNPDVTEPALLDRFEPEVGVPVRVPSLNAYGARWEGASVLPVRAMKDQRAASLRYSVGGHKVTLYVYNSARVPLRATLEPRVIYNTPVYVGQRRGYSIAAVERRGVGYAVATDLNDRESAELAVATLH